MSAPLTPEERIKAIAGLYHFGERMVYADRAVQALKDHVKDKDEELQIIRTERDTLKADHVHAESVINTEKGVIEEAAKAFYLIKDIMTNDGTMLRPSLILRAFELYPDLVKELKQ